MAVGEDDLMDKLKLELKCGLGAFCHNIQEKKGLSVAVGKFTRFFKIEEKSNPRAPRHHGLFFNFANGAWEASHWRGRGPRPWSSRDRRSSNGRGLECVVGSP